VLDEPEISESLLPGMNGIAAFKCSPWDSNPTRSSSQPLKRNATGSEDHVCEMFNDLLIHQRIQS